MAKVIFWTKRAERKFNSIIEYIQKEWNDPVVSFFVKRVYAFINVLVEFPEIGKVEHEERDIRAFVVEKRLIIFYRATPDRIIILNLFDTRQSARKRKY